MRYIGKVWLALLILASAPIVSVAVHSGSHPLSRETVVYKNMTEPTMPQLEAKALEMARERQNAATADNEPEAQTVRIRSQWI